MDPSGVNIRAAVRRPPETTEYGDGFGSSLVTNLLPLLSESMTNAPELDQDEALTGVAAAGDADVVGWNVGGSVPCSLWFEGLEYLFLAAMGFECPTVYAGEFGSGSGGSPAPDDAGDPQAFTHLFECDDTLHRTPWLGSERDASSGGPTDPTYWDGNDMKVRSVLLAIDKGVPADKVHDFQDSMIKKMSISLGLQKCSAAFDLASRQHTRAWVWNRDNWVAGARDRALFTGLDMTIGPVGASQGSSYPVQDVEFSTDNSLDTSKASGATSQYIIEPVRGDGGRKTTGKFKIARFRDDQYQTWMEDGTNLQVVFTLTGPLIPGTTIPFKFQWVFPNIKVRKAAFPVAGPGVITGDVEFEAYRPESTQPWLTSMLGGLQLKKNNEFLMLLTNSRAACFSRDRQAAGVTLP